MVLYEIENAFLFYDRQYDMITFKWLGLVGDKDYRKALEVAYIKTIELGVTRWLTDSRKGIASSQKSQQWIINEFIPNYLRQTPLQKIACIVGEDLMRREYIDAVCSVFDDYQVEVFDNSNIAKEWLIKISNKE